MTTRNSLGLGLVGCGGFGAFCLDAYAGVNGVHLAAVADVQGDVADAFGKDFGVTAYRDPAALIADPNVDLVHVATPPSSHHELSLAALRAGKNVLCEKPLAMTVAQGDELLAAAEAAAAVCPVNFILRYNTVSEAVRRVIDTGVLGKVLGAGLTNCARDTPLPPDHWFWDKSVSGGIFIEHGVHFFDLYSSWFGPGRVIAAHAETREGTRQEDRVQCTMRYDSGTLATHYHGFDQIEPMDRAVHRLICEMGDIHVEGWIPLTITLDAAVDDEGAAALAEAVGPCSVDVIDEYGTGRRHLMGRGIRRYTTKRLRIHACPQPNKLNAYAQSLRDLLADQIAAIRDPSHARRITEANGRDALVFAEQATALAQHAKSAR